MLLRQHLWTSAVLLLLVVSQLSARPHHGHGHKKDRSHRQRRRHNWPTYGNTCTHVRAPPASVLRDLEKAEGTDITSYYTKYTEAYNIPVLGSSEVSDDAMSRACYVLRFALSESPTLRNAYYRLYGRIVVLPTTQSLQDIPEFSLMKRRRGIRSRSHAATPEVPITAAGEENIMCHGEDRYEDEDLLLRQIVLGAFNLAAVEYRPDYRHILEDLYENAMKGWVWANTLAAKSPADYLGEAVQIYFDVNGYSNAARGEYNDIHTRWKLMMYDPAICNFVIYFFPCANHYIPRCRKTGNEAFQILKHDCYPPYLDFFAKNVKWSNREPYQYSENG